MLHCFDLNHYYFLIWKAVFHLIRLFHKLYYIQAKTSGVDEASVEEEAPEGTSEVKEASVEEEALEGTAEADEASKEGEAVEK